MESSNPAARIDVRGQMCPYPLVEIKLALKRLEDGRVLEVITDYEPTIRTTVPALCERSGYPLAVTEIAAKTWQALIEKRALRAGKEPRP